MNQDNAPTGEPWTIPGDSPLQGRCVLAATIRDRPNVALLVTEGDRQYRVSVSRDEQAPWPFRVLTQPSRSGDVAKFDRLDGEWGCLGCGKQIIEAVLSRDDGLILVGHD